MTCTQWCFGGGVLIAAVSASLAAATVRANSPPTISIELAPGDEVEPSTEVGIRVRISDPGA